MIAAMFSLGLLGAALGLVLGIANRLLRVAGNPVVDELAGLLPGSNCGQCGFPGCAGAADAIAAGTAPPTCCPAVSRTLAADIAARLGLTLDLSALGDAGPRIAAVEESLCIGCCRCARVCPTDAILGASRQIHAVFHDACTGCGSCLDTCPTAALALTAPPVTLPTWVMPRPLPA